MIIKYKKLHPDAVVPVRGHETDAGADLVAVGYTSPNDYQDYYEYETGLAVEIPPGFVGLVFPRSSISKTSLVLRNSVGVIDPDYRGEIKLRFSVIEDAAYPGIYKPGDRIGQLVIVPIVIPVFEEAELSNTERGEGGFGSTGG